VYFDLLAARARQGQERAWPDAALCRIEQLYPVPMEELRDLVSRYPNLEDLIWVQEEMENMGAWRFLRTCLEDLPVASGSRPVQYVGRPASGSPAEGSATRFRATQQELINRAWRLGARELVQR
jgi:2-oxoglutarate dehydrogenase E1 component